MPSHRMHAPREPEPREPDAPGQPTQPDHEPDPPPVPWHDPGPPVRKINLPPDTPTPAVPTEDRGPRTEHFTR